MSDEHPLETAWSYGNKTPCVFIPDTEWNLLSKDGLLRFLKDRGFDVTRDFKVDRPMQYAGRFVYTIPKYKYDCECGIEVKEPFCSRCGEKVVSY